MINANHNFKQNGMSLIDVMIALAIAGIGLLTMAYMQVEMSKQAGVNKARAEATALAEARIEDMRNYTNLATSQAEFDVLLAATGGFTNDESIAGVNADFVRQVSIQPSGNVKEVKARVSWQDRAGMASEVVMSSEIAWMPPNAPGQKGRAFSTPDHPPPNGRVKLGEGTLPEGTPTISNDDGTSEAVIDNDKFLTVGDQIVLTLQNACDESGCIDFGRVNGRVYIDRASQPSLKVGEVAVLASNTAYCTRFYLDATNNLVVVNNATTSGALSKNSGDYEYFDYRCYVSGGWYGNIGVHLAGGNSQGDKICMGDPNSSESWSEPAMSAYRVYRGAIYKHDGSTASGKAEDEEGNVRYWSIGVPDSVVLGLDHSTGTPRPMHNFVVSSMPTSADSGEDCISRGVLVRGDSRRTGKLGDLFEDVPGDFYCLNPNLDSFDPEVYGMESTCPEDVSNLY